MDPLYVYSLVNRLQWHPKWGYLQKKGKSVKNHKRIFKIQVELQRIKQIRFGLSDFFNRYMVNWRQFCNKVTRCVEMQLVNFTG